MIDDDTVCSRFVGTRTTKHNVPRAPPDGYDVDGPRILWCTSTIPATDLRFIGWTRWCPARSRRLSGLVIFKETTYRSILCTYFHTVCGIGRVI